MWISFVEEKEVPQKVGQRSTKYLISTITKKLFCHPFVIKLVIRFEMTNVSF